MRSITRWHMIAAFSGAPTAERVRQRNAAVPARAVKFPVRRHADAIRLRQSEARGATGERWDADLPPLPSAEYLAARRHALASASRPGPRLRDIPDGRRLPFQLAELATPDVPARAGNRNASI